MRSGLLLTAAAAAAINNGCDDRLRSGCGRVAIALVGGFSDITRGGGHHAKFSSTNAINASHPLTRAWVRVTSKSLRKHVREPLAEAYASAADVFVYSWDKPLEATFAERYEPVAAEYADNAPVLAQLPQLKGTLPKECDSTLVSRRLTRPEKRVKPRPKKRTMPKAQEACHPRGMHYSRSDATRAHAVGHMHAASASWAYAVREVHRLIVSHEARRGGLEYEAVYFGRPDIYMYKSLDAARVPDNAVLMPSPGFGDNFFLMARDNARKFSEMYHVAETSYGCEIGCVTSADRCEFKVGKRPCDAAARAKEDVSVDGQLWKSVFVQRRMNATLVAALRQPLDVAPYRFFYDMCKRFRPLGDDPRIDPGVATTRSALYHVGITPGVLDILLREEWLGGRRPCTWLCNAYPAAMDEGSCRGKSSAEETNPLLF